MNAKSDGDTITLPPASDPRFFSRWLQTWRLRWAVVNAVAGQDDDELARALKLIARINDKLGRRARAVAPRPGTGPPSLNDLAVFVDVPGLLARRNAFLWDKLFALRCSGCRCVFAFTVPFNEGLRLIEIIARPEPAGLKRVWKRLGRVHKAPLRVLLAMLSKPLAQTFYDGSARPPSKVCPRCRDDVLITPRNAAYFP